MIGSFAPVPGARPNSCRSFWRAAAICLPTSLWHGPAVSLAAASETLYISEYAIVHKSGALQEPEPGERQYDPVKLRRPLVLWTKLAGNQTGLDRLKAGGFRLHHKWEINCGGDGTRVWSDEAIGSEKDISVDDGQNWPAVADKLQIEVDNKPDHTFDWRTASERQQLLLCTYTIRVTDEWGEPLYCKPLSGPCLITFQAQ
jgi:hypothetical protein